MPPFRQLWEIAQIYLKTWIQLHHWGMFYFLFSKNWEYKYCITIFLNVSLFWNVVMKENSLLKLYALFLLKQHFPSLIFSWEKQTRPVWMMFIIIVILTDLFLLLLSIKFFDFLQTFNLSHHNSGFCNDMLFYCIIQASMS